MFYNYKLYTSDNVYLCLYLYGKVLVIVNKN